MRILIISGLLLTLTSCTLPFGNNTPPEVPPPGPQTETPAPAPVVEKVVASGSLTSLNYTLRDGSADGKVLETTISAVAQANGVFSTGATYQPFQVMIGTNSVILGFENGLIGMKKGEKKVIRVSPEEGYGTGAKIQEVPKYQIAPVFTIVQPKNLFGDTITQTVEKATLNDEMKNAQVGQTLTGANGATAKVTAVTADSVTFEIQNSDNPFYKQAMKVGSTAENTAASFKVTKMTDEDVTLEVTNKQSIFYNKKFEVGESFTLPQGGKVSIISIGEDKVTIGEEHPMAGKTLFFDVEITDIQ